MGCASRHQAAVEMPSQGSDGCRRLYGGALGDYGSRMGSGQRAALRGCLHRASVPAGLEYDGRPTKTLVGCRGQSLRCALVRVRSLSLHCMLPLAARRASIRRTSSAAHCPRAANGTDQMIRRGLWRRLEGCAPVLCGLLCWAQGRRWNGAARIRWVWVAGVEAAVWGSGRKRVGRMQRGVSGRWWGCWAPEVSAAAEVKALAWAAGAVV
jgi:hypothetical protein